MVIAAQAAGLDAFPLSHAILRAVWAEERDISRPEVRQAIAEENGYDGARLLAAETSEPVQALYRQFSAEAEQLGVFGAPTFVIGGDGELFWGQDRLDFVDRKLDALRGAERHGPSRGLHGEAAPSPLSVEGLPMPLFCAACLRLARRHLLLPAPAGAQQWPDKPITVVNGLSRPAPASTS